MIYPCLLLTVVHAGLVQDPLDDQLQQAVFRGHFLIVRAVATSGRLFLHPAQQVVYEGQDVPEASDSSLGWIPRPVLGMVRQLVDC